MFRWLERIEKDFKSRWVKAGLAKPELASVAATVNATRLEWFGSGWFQPSQNFATCAFVVGTGSNSLSTLRGGGALSFCSMSTRFVA